MYAFTAFKWGPAWAEQTCFSEKNPQPTKPPKTPTKRNCRSNLIIQAEQRIEVLNPLLLWKAIVIFDDHNAFTSAEVFPFVKQNPNSIPGQCQPLNN